MKKILFTLGVLLVAIAIPLRSWLIEPLSAQDTPITDVREGDVIFHTSQSSQSPLIQIGTRSHITHCGIVVIKDGKYWLKRSDRENIKIEYAHYLGKPYDLAFSFDNDIYYCSELVYVIYKEQLGIKLCQPKRIDDYLILCSDKLPIIEREMQRRGITTEQYAVAPVDIFESKNLYSIK